MNPAPRSAPGRPRTRTAAAVSVGPSSASGSRRTRADSRRSPASGTAHPRARRRAWRRASAAVTDLIASTVVWPPSPGECGAARMPLPRCAGPSDGAPARLTAQLIQARHSGFFASGFFHLQGRQLGFVNGRTTQPSRAAICRIAGIQTRRCESPMTAIDLFADGRPSRQTRELVSPLRGSHPGGYE